MGGRDTAEVEDIIITVQLMRRQEDILLMACCDKRDWDLDTMLEGGSEPLSEPQLSLRLTWKLVLAAVCLFIFVCLFISIMDMQYEMVIRMDRHKSKQLNSRHLSNKIPKNKLDIRH